MKIILPEYGYERVFLATEDRDILKTMREKFGKQIVAVAQEGFICHGTSGNGGA